MKRPILDWRSRHDERSRNYAIRETIGTVEPRTKLWRQGTVLDQGEEGACVGFSWTGSALASPVGKVVTPEQGNAYALHLYKQAQTLDPWEGEDYSGTSVLAGAEAMRERGLIGSYRWAFSVEDVRDAIITTGPVVIGIPWYENMYQTRQSGLVEVGGNLVGGHAIFLTGYIRSLRLESKTREVIRWRNSWGPWYGLGGTGYIEVSDLAGLLADNGEACIPMEKKRLVLP